MEGEMNIHSRADGEFTSSSYGRRMTKNSFRVAVSNMCKPA